MIVPMRKLSLLIFYRDYQAFLGELREKGVVHIHENKKRSAEDEELKHKFAVIKRIGEMIKQLSKRIPETKETFTELLERWSQAMEPKESCFLSTSVLCGRSVERRVRSNRIGFADFPGKPVQTNGTYRSTDCFAGKRRYDL